MPRGGPVRCSWSPPGRASSARLRPRSPARRPGGKSDGPPAVLRYAPIAARARHGEPHHPPRPAHEEQDMTTPVDPNDVLMTGENSFVRLSHDGGKTLADRWSHWRVLWCPAGPGHVLLVQAELTGGKPRVYSDNIAMTRWLQRSIESILFPPSADPALPVIEASFERSGDPRGAATERVVSADDEIVLAWYDFY